MGAAVEANNGLTAILDYKSRGRALGNASVSRRLS